MCSICKELSHALKFLCDVAGDALKPNLESNEDCLMGECDNEEAHDKPQEDHNIAPCPTSFFL